LLTVNNKLSELYFNHWWLSSGKGETFYLPRAVSAVIHDVFATLLIGCSPFDIEQHWHNLFSTVNFFGYAGSETRAISAVDVALWNILGQYDGRPIYHLLGGRCRDRIRIYNTCVSHGPHQDFHAWFEGRAGALAEELLASGITAMKVWPFDQFGVSLGGPVGSRAGVGAVGPVGHYLKTQVPDGKIMVWWLGGTGFVFKTPAGTQVFVDPYFSNCVAAIFGVERAFSSA